MNHHSAPNGRQLAVRLGPELIAFALSVMVLIGVAILFAYGLGPASAGPGSSAPAPTSETSAVERATGSLVVRNWNSSLVASVPGRPARAQA